MHEATGQQRDDIWRRVAALVVGVVVGLLSCILIWQRVACTALDVARPHAAACALVRDWPLGLLTLGAVLVFLQLTAKKPRRAAESSAQAPSTERSGA